MKEMLYIFFYLWYFIARFTHSFGEGYACSKIPFQKDAGAEDRDQNDLSRQQRRLAHLYLMSW